MQKRKRYDTSVIYLYSIGKENILPKSFRKTIPDANKTLWRQKNYADYIGSEYRYVLDDLIEREALKRYAVKSRKTLYGLSRLYLDLHPILNAALKNIPKDDKSKKILVEAILSNRMYLSAATMLRLLNIAPGTFYSYLNEIRYKCSHSPLLHCVRSRPQQIPKDELHTMRKMLLSKKLQYWPVCSICYYASRTNKLHASLSSWYKYRKVLGLPGKRVKKKIKWQSLQAYLPNEIWHMDVTRFRIENGKVYNIYLVIDNYSKMVLSWYISRKLQMQFSKKVLQQAYEFASKFETLQHTQLIVDGGSENHNSTIENFLAGINGGINKLTALKDITFSNSRIESFNKLLKYNYLNLASHKSLKALKRFVAMSIFDYNNVRPHHSLKGYTPYEIYTSHFPDIDYTARRKEAGRQRIARNRCVNCACTNKANCANRGTIFPKNG